MKSMDTTIVKKKLERRKKCLKHNNKTKNKSGAL
jgi:hypothetical protein